MRTNPIIAVFACLLTVCVIFSAPSRPAAQSGDADSMNELSTANKIKLYNSLSDTAKTEWIKTDPKMKTLIEEQDTKATPGAESGMPSELPESSEPGTLSIEEPASRIETILSGEFPDEIAKELTQYGYEFFTNAAISFAPAENIPVGDSYVIGPGDNFKINIWGKFEGEYDVTVDRRGSINIPRIGTVNVSGLTYAELKTHLYHRFKEFYTDFEISITMGELRTIGIFVVGEALVPGTYSVSSLSTLITALFQAKGPTKNGSLRNIQLIRNAEVVSTLDLYSFFLEGDKIQDQRLMAGDTIFIPVIGPVAGIAGNVRRPAIYELMEGQDIYGIIQLAGGLLPTGDLQNVVVERIEGNQKRVIKSFNIDPDLPMDHADLSTTLKDGDLIKIYPVHKEIRNVVTLEGHVKYPREYEFRPGMRLKDLIPSYDALLPEPFLAQGEIMRSMPPDQHIEIVKFDLGKMLAGNRAANLELKELDRVIVYHKWEKENRPQVQIKGAVNSPGVYTLYDGMDIKDLIFQAGNVTDKAYRTEGTLTRLLVGKGGTDNISLPFSPDKAMAEQQPDNMALEPNDTVFIRQIPQIDETLKRTVALEGEFVFPGEYSFSDGERISSIIRKAGGLTQDGYAYGAVFERESVREIQGKRFKDYVDTLEEEIFTASLQMAETSMDKDEAAIMAAETGDQKTAPRKNESCPTDGPYDHQSGPDSFRTGLGKRFCTQCRGQVNRLQEA